jgi:hypothetical protein
MRRFESCPSSRYPGRWPALVTEKPYGNSTFQQVISYLACVRSVVSRQPSPQQGQDRVQIGDVGFFLEGNFHRLFSVTHRNPDRVGQEEAAPNDLEPIDIGPTVINSRGPHRIFAVRRREIGASLNITVEPL